MLKAPSNPVPTVWIVEQNLLAAEYLLQILNQDTMLQTRWLQHSVPQKTDVGGGPIFVLDKVGLNISIVECIRNLSSQFDDARYIVLDRTLDRQNLFQLLSLGIHGFLVHEDVVKALRLAILSVWDGRMWIDSRLFQEYTSYNGRTRKYRTVVVGEESMTQRESEILHLVRQRLSNKEIASILNIEVSTVKFHLSNIFSKLQIASRSDLWKNSGMDAEVAAGNMVRVSSPALNKPKGGLYEIPTNS
jgi:DNA-binding NarL/FixJ family response regulator